MYNKKEEFQEIYNTLKNGKLKNLSAVSYRINYFFQNFGVEKNDKPNELIKRLGITNEEEISMFNYICSTFYILSPKVMNSDFWQIKNISDEQKLSLIKFSLLNKKSNFYKRVVEKKLEYTITNKENTTEKEILILSTLHHTGVNTSLKQLLYTVFKDDPKFNKEGFIKVLDLKTVKLHHISLLLNEQIEILKDIKVNQVRSGISKKNYIHQIPEESNIYDYFLAIKFFKNYTESIKFNYKYLKIDDIYISKSVSSIISPMLDLKYNNCSKETQPLYKELKSRYLEQYLDMHYDNTQKNHKRSKI